MPCNVVCGMFNINLMKGDVRMTNSGTRQLLYICNVTEIGSILDWSISPENTIYVLNLIITSKITNSTVLGSNCCEIRDGFQSQNMWMMNVSAEKHSIAEDDDLFTCCKNYPDYTLFPCRLVVESFPRTGHSQTDISALVGDYACR